MVLCAAALHAAWNYQTKKSQNKLAFVWLFHMAALIFYLPAFVAHWPQVTIPSQAWFFIVATGLIHAFYFGFLTTAYDGGDLSMVYPVARGTGPVLVSILAISFIDEQIYLIAGMGIILITSGIYTLHLPSFERSTFFTPFTTMKQGATLWALFTGLTIAIYSLIDKIGVTQVDPFIYIYLLFLGSWLSLSPYALMKKGFLSAVKKEWRQNRLIVLLVGFLCFSTYLIVLYAMQNGKVSYIVSVRESSILMSVLFGIFFLKEQFNKQKVIGSLLIFCGIVLIGISK